MKFIIIFVGMILLAGCSRDVRLEKRVIGTWSQDKTFEMTLASDGSFVSTWTAPSRRVTYQGTWMVRDGKLVSTITNCIPVGTTNFEAVGSVEHCKIAQVDSGSLVYTGDGQMISLSRKR